MLIHLFILRHFGICSQNQTSNNRDAKNMAADVNKMLATIAVECGGMEQAAAEKWVKDLKSAKRYQEDVWS